MVFFSSYTCSLVFSASLVVMRLTFHILVSPNCTSQYLTFEHQTCIANGLTDLRLITSQTSHVQNRAPDIPTKSHSARLFQLIDGNLHPSFQLLRVRARSILGSYFLLIAHSFRKFCLFYLPNRFQNPVTSCTHPQLPLWSMPPSSLAWIVAIAIFLASLFLPSPTCQSVLNPVATDRL